MQEDGNGRREIGRLQEAVDSLKTRHEPGGWCDLRWEAFDRRMRTLEARMAVIVTVASFVASVIGAAIGKRLP